MENVKTAIMEPAFNVEKYSEKCLNFLKHRILKSIEIICVDQSSTNGFSEKSEKSQIIFLVFSQH